MGKAKAAVGASALYDRLYDCIYNAVAPAASAVACLDCDWTEAEMCKKITKPLNKAACDPELLNKDWDVMCKDMVENAMPGYTASCGDAGWFFDIPLVPVFVEAAMEILAEKGQQIPPEAVAEVIQAEYDDKLDRHMLDRAIHETSKWIFKEETAVKKVYQALSKAYWPALDATLENGHLQRELHYGLDDMTELRRVETFLRTWLDDALQRAWASVEASDQDEMNDQTVKDLIKCIIAPFGDEHPFSCLPGALIDRLGRPPTDWAFINKCVHQLFQNWNGEGPRAKKRRLNNRRDNDEDGDAAAEAPQKFNAWGNKGAKFAGNRKRGGRPPMPEEDEAQEEEVPEEGEGGGHPLCTSAEDCIGSPTSQLIRHLHNGKAGDVYCEPCWNSFVERNPNLKGEPVDEADL